MINLNIFGRFKSSWLYLEFLTIVFEDIQFNICYFLLRMTIITVWLFDMTWYVWYDYLKNYISKNFSKLINIVNLELCLLKTIWLHSEYFIKHFNYFNTSQESIFLLFHVLKIYVCIWNTKLKFIFVLTLYSQEIN